jgi:hypothetical protein
VSAVDGSLQSRYAHGVGPEPHSYRMPSPGLTAGDAILVGTTDGDVEAVVTGVEVIPSVYAGSVSAAWESTDGRLSGVADYLAADVVTRPRAVEHQLEAGA